MHAREAVRRGARARAVLLELPSQPNIGTREQETVQCRLTAGIPTILLEQKVLGQPFSKDNSTSWRQWIKVE